MALIFVVLKDINNTSEDRGDSRRPEHLQVKALKLTCSTILIKDIGSVADMARRQYQMGGRRHMAPGMWDASRFLQAPRQLRSMAPTEIFDEGKLK